VVVNFANDFAISFVRDEILTRVSVPSGRVGSGRVGSRRVGSQRKLTQGSAFGASCGRKLSVGGGRETSPAGGAAKGYARQYLRSRDVRREIAREIYWQL